MIMAIRTTFTFTLPRGSGIATEAGRKVQGTMRLAKVSDLAAIERDSTVQRNSGMFYVVLLSRVITSLGKETMITRKTIEKLEPIDFTFLLDMMLTVNHQVMRRIPLICPVCERQYWGELTALGEV